jgi:hypothetical protein
MMALVADTTTEAVISSITFPMEGAEYGDKTQQRSITRHSPTPRGH